MTDLNFCQTYSHNNVCMGWPPTLGQFQQSTFRWNSVRTSSDTPEILEVLCNGSSSRLQVAQSNAVTYVQYVMCSCTCAAATVSSLAPVSVFGHSILGSHSMGGHSCNTDKDTCWWVVFNTD